MKMVCPHCGVKGSADDSLLAKKVKCPKCEEQFTITSDVLQPIAIEDFELEQLEESVKAEDITGEVDDIFDDIFGKDEQAAEVSIAGQEEIDQLLNMNPTEDFDDGTIAALSSSEDDEIGLEEWAQSPAALAEFDDDSSDDLQNAEEAIGVDEDSTLTVIEDFPEAHELQEPEGDDAELSLDDFETAGAFDEELQFDDKLQFDDNTAEEEDAFWNMDESDESLEAGAAEDAVEDGTAEKVADLAADEEEGNDGTVDIDNIIIDDVSELDDDEEYSADDSQGDSSIEKDEEQADEGREELIRKCSACGEYIDPESKHEHGGNVYCSKCIPKSEEGTREEALAEKAAVAAAAGTAGTIASAGKFTISTLIKDAWIYTKGVKGSIWGALIVMYLILIGLGVASVFLLPEVMGNVDSLEYTIAEIGLEVITSFLSYIFTAGIILIAVRKVGQQSFSWRMVFSGFKHLGNLIAAIILQFLLLTIGFCLLILPGIYLTIGYSLTLPLIMVKGLSPWQAMEASRMAIHKRWWTVFFTYIVLGVIAGVSAIPAGIGLIWTMPMFFVLIGVLYYHFFGDED